jgi:glycosyltransferase involved in cell wall biosynthesis
MAGRARAPSLAPLTFRCREGDASIPRYPMKPLAVAIPTYKRPELLRRCLEALGAQCARHDVDIHVYDDSCSDINKPVYDAMGALYPGLRVQYNPVNLGIDRNIDQCITAPDARYVWMIGEDDLAADGAIDALMERLKNSSPEYVFLNYQYISNDYRTLLHVAAPEAVDGPRSAGEFFANLGWATGFLGANVVNKSHWDATSTAYMGTYFNHVGKIFSELSPDGVVEVIARPMVYNRAESLESFTWIKDTFEVNSGFGDMVRALSRHCPAWAAQGALGLLRFEEKMDLRNFKALMVLRALGVYDLDKYRTYVSARPAWPVYAIIAVMPKSVMRFLYRGFKAMTTRRGTKAHDGLINRA